MHPWSDEVLDSLRGRGDPGADSLIAEAHSKELGRYLKGQSPPPLVLKQWFQKLQPPTWLDAERLKRGQSVYGRYAIQMMLGLLAKGLPEAYAAPKGAQILLCAGRFATSPQERLMETARFFIAVMEPGGLDSPNSKGIQDILKVRLVHALSRVAITKSPLYSTSLGYPINQEDMLGTLMSFSTLVLDALPRLGVHLKEEEEEDYFYVWRVVGWYLGIDPGWIPHTVLDGRAFFGWVRQRHQRQSPAGEILTGALLEVLNRLFPLGEESKLPSGLVVYLCGPVVAGWVGVQEGWVPERSLKALGLVSDVVGHIKPLSGPVEALGRAVFEWVYKQGSKGKTVEYFADL